MEKEDGKVVKEACGMAVKVACGMVVKVAKVVCGIVAKVACGMVAKEVHGIAIGEVAVGMVVKEPGAEILGVVVKEVETAPGEVVARVVRLRIIRLHRQLAVHRQLSILQARQRRRVPNHWRQWLNSWNSGKMKIRRRWKRRRKVR